MLCSPSFPFMQTLSHLEISTAAAGIKYTNRDDLLAFIFTAPTRIGGVFTRSRCPSAPVDFCRANLSHGAARALLVNSGNANAFTGRKGAEACTAIAEKLSQELSCSPQEIFLASTGVIGEPLPVEKIIAKIPDMTLQASEQREQAWGKAAKAIMTTDCFPKGVHRVIPTPEGPIFINAIAKGAGMIAPDMATMLAFIFTNAVLPASLCQKLLANNCSTTFNAITVDSDTSTSDTVLFFSIGEDGPVISREDTAYYELFNTALHEVMQELAIQIVQDGEGATKLVTVKVEQATDATAAKQIALSIANSPLVKTAMAGEDANWGRIVAAIGKANQIADRDRISISFGPYCVAKDGARSPDYDESALQEYMKKDIIDINVNLNLGTGQFRVWTCDFTEQYIKINADYRS